MVVCTSSRPFGASTCATLPQSHRSVAVTWTWRGAWNGGALACERNSDAASARAFMRSGVARAVPGWAPLKRTPVLDATERIFRPLERDLQSLGGRRGDRSVEGGPEEGRAGAGRRGQPGRR